jgi:hypothetical protein
VTLNHFYTLFAGISPVAVHDKSNMAWDGACLEYAKEDTLNAIDGIIAKPECVLKKRHYWGITKLIGSVLMEAFSFCGRPRALRLHSTRADVALRWLVASGILYPVALLVS